VAAYFIYEIRGVLGDSQHAHWIMAIRQLRRARVREKGVDSLKS
jgi:CTP synthase (UTP-ammonia lyase)